MGALVVIVGGVPGQTVPEEAQPKETKHDQAETVIP